MHTFINTHTHMYKYVYIVTVIYLCILQVDQNSDFPTGHILCMPARILKINSD